MLISMCSCDKQDPPPPPPHRALETRSRFRTDITHYTFNSRIDIFTGGTAECAVVGIERAECCDDDGGGGVEL